MGHDISNNGAHKHSMQTQIHIMQTQGSDFVAVEVYEPRANGV